MGEDISPIWHGLKKGAVEKSARSCSPRSVLGWRHHRREADCGTMPLLECAYGSPQLGVFPSGYECCNAPFNRNMPGIAVDVNRP